MPNFYEVIPLSHAGLLKRLAVQHLGTWCKFITLHNTSSPSLGLWAKNRVKWSAVDLCKNMESGWRSLGWHTGPHYLVTPEVDFPIFELSDPSAPGVHASCFNSMSIGIEMVGEFNLESFSMGPGAAVRDSSVLLLAALHNRLGLSPNPHVVGKSGLHFHRECIHDHHDCPGKNVNRADLIIRVQNKMADLKSGDHMPPAA